MTYATLLTPPTLGAIAVLQIAGPDAGQRVAGIAPSARIPQLRDGQIARSKLIHKDETLDDALVIRICDNMWEVHLHGGVAVVEAFLDALAEVGTPTLTPAEARQRGILGTGLAADVQLALPQALTMTAARLLAAQSDGGLTVWATHWRQTVTPATLWQLHAATQWLLTRSTDLFRLLEPARIALIGPPNAGKSTLANALLGRPLAITSDTPGTTRDWIDAPTVFTCNAVHIPVTLVDTAGIRATPDPLEQESILRTHQQMRLADIVILVLDATLPPPADLPPCDLIALNKCDLLPTAPPPTAPVPTIAISAKTHDHLADLMAAVVRQLDLATIAEAEPFAFAPRHRALLADLLHSPNVSHAQALLDTLLTA